MKIAILGDTHFGMRSDSIAFHSLYSEFYRNTLFPYLKENDISKLFQLGDLFDRRKYISFQTLFLCRKYFFDVIQQQDIDFHTLLGNHDIVYKNTLDVNSSTQLLHNYKNISVYDKPITVNVDGVGIDIIPWMCRDNTDEILKFIDESSSQICFGHFELAGFEMDRGNICHDGMDKKFLSRYDLVFCGHFHHRSFNGNILYVGSPGEMTWADYNDKRGFHVFDTETREITFVENPYRMFYKIFFDDSKMSIDDIKKIDFSPYKDRIVKVVVEDKGNSNLFDLFLDQLYANSPLNVSIVEDFIDYSEISEEDVIDQADDTLTIIHNVVDGLETSLSKEKLKVFMRDIYNNSLFEERS